MPNFNGTGPAGMGAGTGRGRGPCTSKLGRGFRSGWRRFWGGGFPNNSVLTKENEAEVLAAQASALTEELEAIKNRLKELKK